MKKIILLIVSVWMCVSCGNLEEMNIDPDNATQTHPKLLLTQICMNAFKRGTDGMYATKKVIQADGESAVYTGAFIRSASSPIFCTLRRLS